MMWSSFWEVKRVGLGSVLPDGNESDAGHSLLL